MWVVFLYIKLKCSLSGKEGIFYVWRGKNVILDRCALSTVAISYAFERLGKYPKMDFADV